MLEEITNNLKGKIEKSLNSSNLSNIFLELEKINSPTLICGVGGSHVVSIFMEKVLHNKNNIITKNIDIEEYFLDNFYNYNNLILISHTGKNHGIKHLAKTCKNKYLFTTRKTKINNEKILNYTIKEPVKSFVALENTFIPLSILLSYYLNLNNIKANIIPNKESFNIKDFDNLNIIYDYTTKTCATFLESSFVEAGIAPVTMHTKYSLCHGRSNLISNKESLTIYLMTRNSELDNTLIENISIINNNLLILKEINNDPIIADYILTFKALYFLEYLNKKYKKEFVKVKYNKIVPTIYNFNGELV